MGLDDLPPGWTIRHDYGPWGDNRSMGSEDAGSIVLKFVDAGNAKAEYMSVFLFRFDCPDKAALYFQDAYGDEGVDISTVETVDFGDEAMLCRGNWTGRMGAIKTVVFREYNVIGIIVHETAWQVGLNDGTTIGMVRLQQEKLMV
ncbi:MAG: hypothetical protein ISF22_08250 [Methanomassiliicoccus sp.]|nr:hypothetical protein [Methanomassiliicoccus sp.]